MYLYTVFIYIVMYLYISNTYFLPTYLYHQSKSPAVVSSEICLLQSFVHLSFQSTYVHRGCDTQIITELVHVYKAKPYLQRK